MSEWLLCQSRISDRRRVSRWNWRLVNWTSTGYDKLKGVCGFLSGKKPANFMWPRQPLDMIGTTFKVFHVMRWLAHSCVVASTKPILRHPFEKYGNFPVELILKTKTAIKKHCSCQRANVMDHRRYKYVRLLAVEHITNSGLCCEVKQPHLWTSYPELPDRILTDD